MTVMKAGQRPCSWSSIIRLGNMISCSRSLTSTSVPLSLPVPSIRPQQGNVCPKLVRLYMDPAVLYNGTHGRQAGQERAAAGQAGRGTARHPPGLGTTKSPYPRCHRHAGVLAASATGASWWRRRRSWIWLFWEDAWRQLREWRPLARSGILGKIALAGRASVRVLGGRPPPVHGQE